jgi:hypothetical protein
MKMCDKIWSCADYLSFAEAFSNVLAMLPPSEVPDLDKMLDIAIERALRIESIKDELHAERNWSEEAVSYMNGTWYDDAIMQNVDADISHSMDVKKHREVIDNKTRQAIRNVFKESDENSNTQSGVYDGLSQEERLYKMEEVAIHLVSDTAGGMVGKLGHLWEKNEALYDYYMHIMKQDEFSPDGILWIEIFENVQKLYAEKMKKNSVTKSGQIIIPKALISLFETDDMDIIEPIMTDLFNGGMSELDGEDDRIKSRIKKTFTSSETFGLTAGEFVNMPSCIDGKTGKEYDVKLRRVDALSKYVISFVCKWER